MKQTTAACSPTTPSPSDESDMSVIDDAWPEVPDMWLKVPPLAGIRIEGDLTQYYEVLYGMNQHVDRLTPAFVAFTRGVRIQFEDFLVDVDPACKVTWQPTRGGFDLIIFGMSDENAPHVYAAIVGESSLLKPLGIHATLVSAVEEMRNAVHVSVPYDGEMTIDPAHQ